MTASLVVSEFLGVQSYVWPKRCSTKLRAMDRKSLKLSCTSSSLKLRLSSGRIQLLSGFSFPPVHETGRYAVKTRFQLHCSNCISCTPLLASMRGWKKRNMMSDGCRWYQMADLRWIHRWQNCVIKISFEVKIGCKPSSSSSPGLDPRIRC